MEKNIENELKSKIQDALEITRNAFVSIDSIMFDENTSFTYKCYRIGTIQKDIEEAYSILAKAIGEEGYE